MQEREDERIAGLLQAYLAAEYRWQHDGTWHALRIGLPAPGLERACPDAHAFALLSAWNPQSIPQPEAVNRRADHTLHEALLASGGRCLPACAAAPDSRWREPGWLVMDLPLVDVDALGRRFGQLGVLCWQRGEAVQLRMLAARPDRLDAAPGHPDFVDWVE